MLLHLEHTTHKPTQTLVRCLWGGSIASQWEAEMKLTLPNLLTHWWFVDLFCSSFPTWYMVHGIYLNFLAFFSDPLSSFYSFNNELLSWLFCIGTLAEGSRTVPPPKSIYMWAYKMLKQYESALLLLAYKRYHSPLSTIIIMCSIESRTPQNFVPFNPKIWLLVDCAIENFSFTAESVLIYPTFSVHSHSIASE